MSLFIPTCPHRLSFSNAISSSIPFVLRSRPSSLTLTITPPAPRKTTVIRMGGGPRTYPGGVSKWQWKRMQAKKAKQLLKARLARERQIYEMRKRAELRAAVSELERPWEVVEKAPTLFSVRADEQVKVLADRFQRPGGFDLWTERDGPQLFQTPDGMPSARFFPKGVVHSIKPYGKISGLDELSNEDESGLSGENGGDLLGAGDSLNSGDVCSRKAGEIPAVDQSGKKDGAKWRQKGNRRRFGSANSNALSELDKGKVGFNVKPRRGNPSMDGGRGGQIGRSSGLQKAKNSRSEVYDMNLQQDGSYGLE